MSVKGIIFSAPMVRALLAGSKTQTRRLIAPCKLPIQPGDILVSWPADAFIRQGERFRPPYKVGDRLYVREAFSYAEALADTVWYWADGNVAAFDCSKPKPSIHMPRWASRLWLEVAEVRVQRLQDISEEDAVAEGITFDTIPDGLIPGGNTGFGFPGYSGFDSAAGAYSVLWDTLHTDPGTRWADNPWVCCYSFTVHHGNVDEVGA